MWHPFRISEVFPLALGLGEGGGKKWAERGNRISAVHPGSMRRTVVEIVRVTGPGSRGEVQRCRVS